MVTECETTSSPPPSQVENECCTCNCSRCLSSFLSWQRSVKRRIDQMEDENQRGHVHPQPYPSPPAVDVLARVEIGNECSALREAMARKQVTINELQLEIEEERDASSTAASEAMSMILKLQREKAEVQMEARQFKRFVEEKMAHDQQEILLLEDAFFKRDQAALALSFEVQAYRHRLMSYGIDPDSSMNETVEQGAELEDNDNGNEEEEEEEEEVAISNNNNDATINTTANDECNTAFYRNPACEYPPLRCSVCDIDMNDELSDLDKYAHTPRTPARNGAHDQLQHIEQRIHRIERSSSSGHLNVLDRGVSAGSSPRRPRHDRRFSTDSAGSFLGRDFMQERGFNLKRLDEWPSFVDRDVDARDDASDSVYTIDKVCGVPQPTVGVCEDSTSTPRGSIFRGSSGAEPDVKKLYMRLQALEADRESLKQEIISMRTDKAQLVLLREIAQNLCKGATPPSLMPERRLVKRSSPYRSLPFASVFEWIASFIFWKRKARGVKYAFGLSENAAGLLCLLEKSPRTTRQWRCSLRPRSRS